MCVHLLTVAKRNTRRNQKLLTTGTWRRQARKGEKARKGNGTPLRMFLKRSFDF